MRVKTTMSRKRHRLRASLLAVVVLVSATVMLGLSASPAFAAVQTTTDAQGANDEPGQKDLTQFTSDDASPVGTLLVTVNHDETGFSGANTGDACFLFDTNADGNVNYALCVTFGGNPSTIQTTRLFTCGDDSAFKCTQAMVEVTGFASSCTVDVTNTDPFPSGDVSPADTTTACTIVLADIPGGLLIDVCSYPSQQPNSDPSDCVVHPTGTTAVTLKAFTASATRAGVVLGWRTASEAGTLGFNVYRVKAGKLIKLNRALIASKAVTRGGVYRFLDRTPVKAGSGYRLQEVTLSGDRSWVAAASVARSS
jgi:hypothetical protein